MVRPEGLVAPKKPSPANCWEVKLCGREPGGTNARALGVCPAATEFRLHGTNSGRWGGRACWVVAGTMCQGDVQGTFAGKLEGCNECGFRQRVVREEYPNAVSTEDLLDLLDE